MNSNVAETSVLAKNETDFSTDKIGLRDRFLFLSEGISNFAKKIEIEIIPYRNNSLPHFSKLPVDHQSLVIGFLENIFQTYSSIEKEGKNISDSKVVLWHSIKQLGLRPSSDLFATISDTDVIEIHTPNYQAFRNLNFFRLCSYSIEELTSVHWTELFYREQKHSDAILRAGTKVFTERCAVVPDVALHIVEEISSQFKLKVLYDLKGMFPLFDIDCPSNQYVLLQIEAKRVDQISN